jgi:oxygen-independent coproporphyrinogen-3 oxidase
MRGDGQPTGGFGLYVHWPFCRSKCPYCDFNSHVRAGIDAGRWEAALLREMRSIAARLETRPRLDTVFFGGGTPSLMAPATVASILDAAAALFPLADDLEVTLEANPTSSEAKGFAEFRVAGVNRLSLGVQSLEDAALKFLGRQHSAAEAIAALELAREAFPRLSFDLIYARPDQSPSAWQGELSRAIDLAADHLSLYQLTIEPGTKFATLVDNHVFAPAPDGLAADLFELTQEVTAAAGLPAYEISNHARGGAESQHNLIYWRGGAWLGIGPGAHGRLPAAGNRRIATETEKFPEHWLARVEEAGHGLVLFEPVEEYDQAKELLLMSLRLSEGSDLTLVRTQAADLLDEEALERLVADQLIERNGARIRTAAKGRLVLNRLIAELVHQPRT